MSRLTLKVARSAFPASTGSGHVSQLVSKATGSFMFTKSTRLKAHFEGASKFAVKSSVTMIHDTAVIGMSLQTNTPFSFSFQGPHFTPENGRRRPHTAITQCVRSELSSTLSTNLTQVFYFFLI